MYKSHLAVAAGGYFVAYDYISTEMSPFSVIFIIGMVLTLIGASLPDIDHPSSFIGRKLSFISKPISIFFGHRGITHSFVPPALSILFAGVNNEPYLWLVFGYLMHLVGDFLTDSGIPLLWPLSTKRFKFILVTKTNSIGEPILVIMFLVACFTWIYI